MERRAQPKQTLTLILGVGAGNVSLYRSTPQREQIHLEALQEDKGREREKNAERYYFLVSQSKSPKPF